MKKATLVIAAYKEDLSWLEKINNDELDIVINPNYLETPYFNVK